jgi:glucans biosynthesis protein
VAGGEAKYPAQAHAPYWLKAISAANRAMRCGAKTRSGKPCKGPVVRGRKRCRMHGGAKGSGAQLGNQNARIHGYYSRAAVRERQMARVMVRILNQLAGAVS